MSLSKENQAIFKSVRPKLTTVADPISLLPYLRDVFVAADVSAIKRQSESGRDNGMMELLDLYERKARDLQPLKQALTRCHINIDEIFASSSTDQQSPSTSQEVFDVHKLQAIEQRVTSISSEFRTQVGEVQEKMFEQKRALQTRITQVQNECEHSLSDFTQELTNKNREFERRLRKAENDFQDEMAKIHDDRNVEEKRLLQSVSEQTRETVDVLDRKIAKEINAVKDDVKQQTEFLNSFQNKMTTDVRNAMRQTEELMSTITPLTERLSEIEINLQQQNIQTKTKLSEMTKTIKNMDTRNSEMAERLTKEEESRLESIGQQDNETKSQLAEITSNTHTIKTDIDQRLKDANTEYQIQLETKGKQLEQMRKDFNDFQLQYKSSRKPLQSSILLIGGENKNTLEIYSPSNPSLNRILDCKLEIARSGSVSALLSNQLLYVAGGLGQEDKYLNSMEIFDPLLQIRISDGPSMSVNRNRASAVTLHDRFFVFGGLENDVKPLKSVELFSPHTNQWSPFNNMKHSRYHHSAVELYGKVYLIGGTVNGIDISHISPSVSVLDVTSHSWTENEVKEKRQYSAAAIIDGSIIVTGGNNGSSNLSSCERFDPREGEWRKIGDMKRKRHGHALVSFNGKLIAMGGYDGGQLNGVEEYDSRMNTWNTIETTLKEPKNFFSAVVL